MHNRVGVYGTTLFCLVALAACGGGTQPAATGGTQVSLTIRDTPPSGVSVVSFEILVTGATLKPTDTTKPDVSLLTSPVEIELANLETETAFLNTTGAPAQSYSGLTLTFANPELTFFNGSGGAITVGGKTCLPGQTCEVEPALNAATAALSSPTPPFPLTLGAGTGLGVVVDFNEDASIQTDLSITPTVTLAVLPAVQATGELEEIEKLVGSVTAVNGSMSQFTLQDFSSGQSFVIATNGSTEFDFEGTCAMNNFSCIAVGQILQVDLGVMGDGSFVAKEVELEGEANEEEAEGTVVSVDVTNSQFQVAVVDEQPDVPNVSVGQVVTVVVDTQTSFQVDDNGLSVPGGLSFNGLADMIVGQNVEVKPRTAPTCDLAGNCTITADRVRLDESQITATVNAVNSGGNSFTIQGLPSLFSANGITQILVQAESGVTEFEDVSGVASLSPGNTVSVRGLLFHTAGDPELVANKVRKR